MDKTSLILAAIVREFHYLKRLGERAMGQLGEADFHYRLHGDANSIAVIVKHLHGNMLSRFTDFLTTDGEKPTRDRDREFVEDSPPRQQVMERWESGWQCVFGALASLSDADLGRTVTIRTEPHTAFQAINRQTSHYGYHIGQIVLLARYIKGEAWQYITVPRGQSQQFNRDRGMK